MPDLKSRRRSVSSAGILMYRRAGANLKALLVHPGDPYWRKKDEGAWSIPKGEMDEGEDAAVAARRECLEETGCALSGALEPMALESSRALEGGVMLLRYRIQNADPAAEAAR